VLRDRVDLGDLVVPLPRPDSPVVLVDRVTTRLVAIVMGRLDTQRLSSVDSPATRCRAVRPSA
jgi:hypothetical protein